MSNGKGDKPRNCFSQKFRDNFDSIDWGKGKVNPVDYPEDAENDPDNGKYMRHCSFCGTIFIGNKHRVICKVCANKASN